MRLLGIPLYMCRALLPSLFSMERAMLSAALFVLTLCNGRYALSQAFAPSANFNLTIPPPTTGVRFAIDVVRQINRSYKETCFVYTHDVDGLNRHLHLLEGVTAGVTKTRRVPFSSDVTRGLSARSRCSVFVTALPATVQELLDYDRALWVVSSPRKIVVYLQDEDGNPDRGLSLARFIPAINTTFTHVLLRRIAAFNQGLNESQDLIEMYCLAIDPPVKVLTFAQCRTMSETFSDVTMTVSHIVARPTIYQGSSRTMVGSDVTILKMLQRKHGFQYRLRRETVLDSRDNSTVGMIRRVGSGSSDLGIGGALQTPDRLRQVTFLVFMYIQDMAFITPTPKPIDIFYTIALPFDKITWGLIAACSVSLIVVIQMCDLFWKKYFFSDAVNKIDTMYHHAVIVFSSLIGYELPHRWLWHRMVHAKSILLAVTIFSGFFLNMDYKSTLRTNLYLVEYSKAIDTPEEIYQSGLPIFIQNASVQATLLASSPRAILQKIYNQAQDLGTMYNTVNGANPPWLDQLIDRGQAVFIYYTLALGSRNGTYHISNDVIYRSISSFFAPKCSILPDLFNLDILWLHAAGLPSKLFKRFLGAKYSPGQGPSARNVQFHVKTTDDPLSVEQVLLIFIILAGGLITATLAFAYESYSDWRRVEDPVVLAVPKINGKAMRRRSRAAHIVLAN